MKEILCFGDGREDKAPAVMGNNKLSGVEQPVVDVQGTELPLHAIE